MSVLWKRIYLIGPHSTGKSTLAKALLSHYGESTEIISEIARKILVEKGYSAATIDSDKCLQMQEHILEGQFQAEEHLVAQDKVFICDRSGVDPIVYAKKYACAKDDWIKLISNPRWNILQQRYQDTAKSILVLLQPVDQFLQNDGTRKMPKNLEEWRQFGTAFAEFLEDQKIPFEILGPECMDINDRVKKVVGWVDRAAD